MLTKKDSIKNEVKSSKAQKANNTTTAETTPTAKTSNGSKSSYQTTPKSSDSRDSYSPSTSYSDKKTSAQKTKITIKYDAGYPNQLYIRGKGANLSWEKGQPLRNVKADEWVWETDAPFSSCEFKVLMNDKIYEKGENHPLTSGATVIYTPQF
jgi:hypothetical protein